MAMLIWIVLFSIGLGCLYAAEPSLASMELILRAIGFGLIASLMQLAAGNLMVSKKSEVGDIPL